MNGPSKIFNCSQNLNECSLARAPQIFALLASSQSKFFISARACKKIAVLANARKDHSSTLMYYQLALFLIKYTIKLMVYCSHFQIWSAPVGYGRWARGMETIRNRKVFWVNNNVKCATMSMQWVWNKEKDGHEFPTGFKPTTSHAITSVSCVEFHWVACAHTLYFLFRDPWVCVWK